MKLLSLPAGKVDHCCYCGKSAGYVSMFFARSVCGMVCAQLLHMEWLEMQRYNELETPYHVFKENCNIF
jgi:hypothetical protein